MRGIRIAAAIALFAASAVPSALANPDGGQVVAGSATVQGQGTAVVTVNQSSQKTILNWESFSIKEGELTKFLQPNAQAIALNRVIGGDPSLIYGTLSANGRLILINPNGLMIGPSGTVNANSFIASTAGISDENFLAGTLTFDIAGNPNARIVNEGTVTAGDAGLVAFVAPAVKNSGLIQAKLGTVTLGAATKFTLDFYGDELVSFPIDAEVAEAVDGAKALVEAGGRIEGQNIVLSARAARGVIDDVIIADGELIARSASVIDGKIRLGSGPHDLARASSDPRASAEFAAVEEDAPESGLALAGAGGGTIKVEGGVNGRVVLAGLADASGVTGGAIEIRGDQIQISGGALAQGSVGSGGAISVFGTHFVSFGGLLSADGGNGGTINITSSLGDLFLSGTATSIGKDEIGGSVRYAGERIVATTSSTTEVTGYTSGGVVAALANDTFLSSGAVIANGLSGRGGRIDLGGDSVVLLSAQLSATGSDQGGLVRVGGAFQGGAQSDANGSHQQSFVGRWDELPPLAAAGTTYVNDSSVISVYSSHGIGGTAIIWSKEVTNFLGSIDARGALGGGSVEISGQELLAQANLTNVQIGPGGNLLLDPKNIAILGESVPGGGDFRWTIRAIAGSDPGANGINVPLAPGSRFGSAVALNAAGDRLAIGAGNADGQGGFGRGAVYLFTFADNNFSSGALQAVIGDGVVGGKNIDVPNFAASSLSLNAAGNRLAVGGDGVYLFSFADNNFSGGSLRSTISSPSTGFDGFGSSVSLNGIGNRLAVGASTNSGVADNLANAGAVYLFGFADANFSGANLRAIIGSGYGGTRDISIPLSAEDYFGTSVSLNAAGDRLAVGAPGDDGLAEVPFSDTGAVYLFSFANNSFDGGALRAIIGEGYNEPTNVNVALDQFDAFGMSVDLNEIGNVLAIGAPGDDGFNNGYPFGNFGAAYLISFADENLSAGSIDSILGAGYVGGNNVDLVPQLPEIPTFTSFTSLFESLSLNAAGDRLAVGAQYYSGEGTVFLLSGSGVGGPSVTAQTFSSNPHLEIVISASALASILASGASVTLQANNDIFFGGVSDPVSLIVNNPNGNGGNLTFLAGRRIFFNGQLLTDGGNFTAVANVGSDAGLFTANPGAGVISAYRDSGAATFNMTSGSSISTCVGTTNICGDVRISLRNGLGQTYADAGDINLERILAGSISVDHLGALRGNINVNNSLTAVDQGASIILASTAGNFSNGCLTCGTGLLTTPRGHWLVYGQNPGSASDLVGQSLFNVGYNPTNPIGAYGAAPPSPYTGRFLYNSAPPAGYQTPTVGTTSIKHISELPPTYLAAATIGSNVDSLTLLQASGGIKALTARLNSASDTYVAKRIVDFVELAFAVYDNPPGELNGYKIVDLLGRSSGLSGYSNHNGKIVGTSGFDAAVYEKDGHYIVVFEGTWEITGDVPTDLKHLVSTQQSAQQRQALEITQAVLTLLAKGDTSRMTIVGHSLGGNLAQYVGTTNFGSGGTVSRIDTIAVNSAPIRDPVSQPLGNILVTGLDGEFAHKITGTYYVETATGVSAHANTTPQMTTEKVYLGHNGVEFYFKYEATTPAYIVGGHKPVGSIGQHFEIPTVGTIRRAATGCDIFICIG